MKHIFFVHSSITYLVSLAIIEYQKINIDSVIVFSETFTGDNLPIKPVSLFNGNKSFFFKTRRINFPKYIDRYIEKNLQNEKFTLYMQSALPIQKVFMTNKNCVGFNFFEEGMANYHKHDNIKLLSVYNKSIPWRITSKNTIKYALFELNNILRGYSPRLKDLPSWPNCYYNFESVEYFCFSEFAFQGIPEYKRKVLKFNILKGERNKDIYDDFSGKTILIGDNVVRFYDLPVKKYLKSIEEGLVSFNTNINKLPDTIFVKFHQAETLESRQETLNMLEKLNIKYSEIKPGTPMELLFLNSKNCNVIGVTSSLLYYAALMGHNVFSVVNYLDLDNSYVDESLSFYWKVVKKL